MPVSLQLGRPHHSMIIKADQLAGLEDALYE
jgi:hypothetical protein